jgi:hypothetical protein
MKCQSISIAVVATGNVINDRVQREQDGEGDMIFEASMVKPLATYAMLLECHRTDGVLRW